MCNEKSSGGFQPPNKNTTDGGRDAAATITATFDFFNPFNEIDIYEHGRLPHWEQENVWYFITFRLADSLPQEVAEKIKHERELWLKRHCSGGISAAELTTEEKIEYYTLFSKRIEDLLNAGHGSCVLKNTQIAEIVESALLYFNESSGGNSSGGIPAAVKEPRYTLDEYIIMPNHVHLLVKPLGDNQIAKILHSWKSFTANAINKLIGKQGQLWQRESYDHIVRNQSSFHAFQKYIRENSSGGILPPSAARCRRYFSPIVLPKTTPSTSET